ncbi:MAG: methyltransferase [Pseudonocardiaceae bacterium]
MTQTASLDVTSGASSALPPWPAGFERIPDEDWTRQEPDDFGRQYDSVGEHGWYKNLEPTVAQVLAALNEDDILMDYSSGTGLLGGRILSCISHHVGILNVDASAKFLRVALDNFADDERVAFRLLRFLKDQKRLQTLDEVVDQSVLNRGVDVITSANAIHLYYNLAETLESWHRALRPGGLALICSGNLRNPHRRPGEWIIDDTVANINEIAADIVVNDPCYAEYRSALDDADRMATYAKLREKIFVPVRPLDLYLDAFADAGFTVQHCYDATIYARIDEWYEMLAAYSEGVLGWIGGSVKVDGRPPTETAAQHRLKLIRQSLEKLFPGKEDFPCSWTYITCRK